MQRDPGARAINGRIIHPPRATKAGGSNGTSIVNLDIPAQPRRENVTICDRKGAAENRLVLVWRSNSSVGP